MRSSDHTRRPAHSRTPSPASRVIIVSNRVPPVLDDAHKAGGLVSAVFPGLEARGGTWIGWSGQVVKRPEISTVPRGTIEYVTVDFTPEEKAGYYDGFANSTLWPLLHSMPDRASYTPSDYRTYREVARKLASLVAFCARSGDVLWVHDYQLLPLGVELRDLGWDGPIGYFHHVPVPEAETWLAMPHGDTFAGMLRAYDIVGVQSVADAERLSEIAGASGPRIGVYPVAIDAEEVRQLAAHGEILELAPQLDERQLLVGIDRLDYTKGIPQRLEAFERLLERRPDLRDQLLFVQWAASSRESLAEYRLERDTIAEAAARINRRWTGRHVLLSCRNRPRATVASALRLADVCVTTPLSDGMNLVAKEFAAVHDALHPGILVLSENCGAARELPEALLVDSRDTDAISAAIERAVDMGGAERSARAQALRRRVDARSARGWFDAFIRDLERTARGRGASGRGPGLRPASFNWRTASLSPELRQRWYARIDALDRGGVVDALWRQDVRLWPRMDGIDALRWLDTDFRSLATAISAMARDVRREGYRRVLVLGMGGPAAAANLAVTLAPMEGGLPLTVLESTIPADIQRADDATDDGATLFVVSSSSGTTVETRALLDYFWARHPHGGDFVAITGSGRPLEMLAAERGFRAVFRDPPGIGGRYSALSAFGLVPAALAGADLGVILDRLDAARQACREPRAHLNAAVRLGALVAEACKMGMDKLTLLLPPERAAFGRWLEQLIAESTGKDGKGILPVLGEPPGRPGSYDSDRLFASWDHREPHLAVLSAAGQPVIQVESSSDGFVFELFSWQVAIAIVGHILGINPFDQPDVEAAKQAARAALSAPVRAIPRLPLSVVLAHAATGSARYLSLHAYLPRDAETEARLRRAQAQLRDRYHLAVTVEYGPALVHSTGQYHKGGPDGGTLIQLRTTYEHLPIPGSAYDFGALTGAIAEGDLQVMLDHGQFATWADLNELEQAIADLAPLTEIPVAQ